MNLNEVLCNQMIKCLIKLLFYNLTILVLINCVTIFLVIKKGEPNGTK